MKISELIAELEKAMAEHGDMPVFLNDEFSGYWINDPTFRTGIKYHQGKLTGCVVMDTN